MTFLNTNQIEIKNTPKQSIKIYHYHGKEPTIVTVKVNGTKEPFFMEHDEEWIRLYFKNDLPVGTILIIEWEVNS